ncbi:peptide chain release factor 2 [Patescibacteria group bacterium]|nr:peptide chain release factor 2 [Patescibacteria group bacterium]
MKELYEKIEALSQKITETWVLLDLDSAKNEMKSLDFEMAESDFWSNPTKAKTKSQRREEIQDELTRWQQIKQDVEDLLAVTKDAEKEKDVSLKSDIESQLVKLEKKFSSLEFYILLDNKYDQRNAIIAIHAGTGGVDAQDWSAMLLRMYIRFSERHGWVVKVIDKSVGQEAGVKSVTFEVSGRYAYGYLQSEAGVHRLVRISPFDAEKMRHTSFALVEVLPELEEKEDTKIDEKDLRIDTFTASGHGGQSVNTTHSAVRIVHLPTGISVSCQNERSQQQNKATALKILKSKLHKLNEADKQVEKQKLRGEYQEAAWGNQVRSYVLHPYKMVKDHRTKFETSEVDDILDGKLDDFMESYLRLKAKR